MVACRSCGEALTGQLDHLSELPEPEQLEDGIGYAPTVSPGNLAGDPGPVGWSPDGRPTSTVGCLVANPADGRNLVVHPEPRRNSGCCGHDGLDGPNKLCARCQTEVATLRDDCWSLVELRFEPAAISLIEAAREGVSGGL